MKLEDYEVLLLIDRQSGAVFPFSAHGFHYAQGRLQAIMQRTSGALFLDQNGAVQAFRQVVPHSNDFLSRWKRMIGIPYGISVTLERTQVSFAKLQDMIRRGIEKYEETCEPDDGWKLMQLTPEERRRRLNEAKDSKGLYKALNLPSPVECLDLL